MRRESIREYILKKYFNNNFNKPTQQDYYAFLIKENNLELEKHFFAILPNIISKSLNQYYKSTFIP